MPIIHEGGFQFEKLKGATNNQYICMINFYNALTINVIF